MPRQAAQFDVVVIAASMGGTAALPVVLAALPPYFPAPVVVVQHRVPEANDHLPAILTRRGGLPAALARDGASLPLGTVTVAPADRRIGFDGDTVDTVRLLDDADGRHDADAVLAHAAERFGTGTLAVMLTGRLDDGALGVRAVKRAGGRVLAQDPREAEATGMPTAAIASGCVDFVLPLEVIGAALVAFVMAPGGPDLLQVPLPPWVDLAGA